MGRPVSPQLSDIRMYEITNYIMAQFQHINKVLFTVDTVTIGSLYLTVLKTKLPNFSTSVTAATNT